MDGCCEWCREEDHDMFGTGCGNCFEFYDGGPKENNFKYCPYCGKKLKIDLDNQTGTE